jgi:nucleoside-diphosphate-sugar epimerase
VKKIGVTGGMGFIGRYVIEELQKKDYVPVIFDHHKRSANEYPEGVEVFLGDVRDDVAMTEFAAHVDGIIHLAAVLGTQETIKNPRPAAMSNLQGGLNFLEACSQYQIPGVYIAVGNWWMNNPYSITKNMIERFVHMFNKDRGTRVNIVRAVNAYGPRQLAAEPFAHGKVRKITPALVCRALSGMPMELYGGGTQVSDMVHVADVAKALVLALEAANTGNVIDHAVEVGPVEHHTIREIAEMVNDEMDSCAMPRVDIVDLPMRPGEKEGDKVTADAETLREIGFEPEDLIGLGFGLHQTVQWYQEAEGKEWHKPFCTAKDCKELGWPYCDRHDA